MDGLLAGLEVLPADLPGWRSNHVSVGRSRKASASGLLDSEHLDLMTSPAGWVGTALFRRRSQTGSSIEGLGTDLLSEEASSDLTGLGDTAGRLRLAGEKEDVHLPLRRSAVVGATKAQSHRSCSSWALNGELARARRRGQTLASRTTRLLDSSD